MIAQPRVIAAGHASNYFEKDDYFSRGSEGFWYGNLKTKYGFDVEIKKRQFDRMVEENEKTRCLSFRFKIFDSIYPEFKHKKEKEKIINLQKEAIKNTLDFVREKYPRLRFDYKYSLGKKEKVLNFEAEERKGSYVTVIRTTDITKKNCGFYEKVTRDNNIFARYNWEFAKLLDQNGYKVEGRDLRKKNGAATMIRGRVCVDWPLNMPKSCSIAAFINNKKYYDEIMNAHHRAIKEALALVEHDLIFYKKIINGEKEQVQAKNGMLCAVWDHFVNRNKEPHIHSHLVTFLNILNNDGKEVRLENEQFFKKYMLVGLTYRNALARNLQEKGFHIEYTNEKQKLLELKGFSRKMIMKFSSRRREIIEELEKSGIEEPNARNADIACRLTRRAKENDDLNLLIESWQHDFQKLGIDQLDLKKDIPLEKVYFDKEAFLSQLMEDLTESKTGFTRHELLYLGMRDGDVGVKDVDDFLKNCKDNGILLENYVGREKYYYTKEGADLERSIFDHLSAGKSKYPGILIEKIDQYLNQVDQGQEPGLTKDQLMAIRFFSNNDRYSCVQGDAGTGKTRLLREILQIVSKEGFSIKGICPTGIGAQNIFLESGIESYTIHRHLNDLEKMAGNFHKGEDQLRKKKWDFSSLEKTSRKEIWIVDEASMISNRLMSSLISAAETRNVKVVFLGDYKQLQSVGPGACFHKMIENRIVDNVRLSENVRHRFAPTELQEAIRLTAKSSDTLDKFFGNLQEVYDSLAALQDRIIRIDDIKVDHNEYDRTPRLDKICADFVVMASEKREKTFILTSQNADREYFNDQIRSMLKEQGELGDGKFFEVRGKDNKTRKLEFSINDKVIFLNNSTLYGVKVKNGTVGKIKEITENKFMVNALGQDIQVDMKHYNYLDHAYSITTHKSQGVTIPEKVFFHIDCKQKWSNYLNSYYVGLTRSQCDISIYTNGSTEDLANLLQKKQYKFSVFDLDGDERVIDEHQIDFSEFDQDIGPPEGSQFSLNS